MFKCKECGHIFKDGEQAIWSEHHPYGMGYAEETFCGCPICKGDYEETTPCLICGSANLEDDLINGVCQDCIDEHSDFESCFKIAGEEKQSVNINSLLCSLFEPNEIEAILMDFIKKNEIKVDCSKFINSDKEWFSGRIIELKESEV